MPSPNPNPQPQHTTTHRPTAGSHSHSPFPRVYRPTPKPPQYGGGGRPSDAGLAHRTRLGLSAESGRFSLFGVRHG